MIINSCRFFIVTGPKNFRVQSIVRKKNGTGSLTKFAAKCRKPPKPQMFIDVFFSILPLLGVVLTVELPSPTANKALMSSKMTGFIPGG